MENVMDAGTFGNKKLTLFASFDAFLRAGACIANVSVNFMLNKNK